MRETTIKCDFCGEKIFNEGRTGYALHVESLADSMPRRVTRLTVANPPFTKYPGPDYDEGYQSMEVCVDCFDDLKVYARRHIACAENREAIGQTKRERMGE